MQETNNLQGFDEDINSHGLACLSTSSKAHGLGFVVDERWKTKIGKVWKVSERVSMLQFKSESKKSLLVAILNAYGPTIGVTERNPREEERLYEQLNEIVSEQRKTSLLIIAGDFSSVVGKRTYSISIIT